MDDPPALVSALLGEEPLDEEMTRQLAPIRAARDVAVSWWGVNDSRVDVVLASGDDEWRIVYGSDDGVTVDWLSVFTRPPRFAGVPGGRAVVVNGPSGSGKSSLLQSIRRAAPVPWVLFDEPVVGDAPQGYLIWRDRSEVLHDGFLAAIGALARAGNCVALSAAGHPQARIAAALAGVPTITVGLRCDLATLERRESGRPGRWGGLAASSLGDHDGWTYDAEFDTTRLDPDQIASEVLRLTGVREVRQR